MKRLIHGVALMAVCGCGVPQELVEPRASTTQAEKVNASPEFLQVYDDNVENLELPSDLDCKGDWRDLLYSMSRADLSPDLFLVQQISNRAQLDLLTQAMSRELAGTYDGVIAEANPEPFGSPCGTPKDLQTNAIVYRTARLDPIGPKQVWKAWRMKDGECIRDPLSRTAIVMQKFHDKLANKDVAVVSLHWSTEKHEDASCAAKNAEELSTRLDGFGGDLLIAGGDTNESDRRSAAPREFKPWYAQLNGDVGGRLGFRDAIYDLCAASPGLWQCLNDNWTIGNDHRIDFLFAKKGNGNRPKVTAAHTITFEEADQAARLETGGDSAFNYSDHRAIRARLFY